MIGNPSLTSLRGRKETILFRVEHLENSDTSYMHTSLENLRDHISSPMFTVQ
jgi:hypothetical protein